MGANWWSQYLEADIFGEITDWQSQGAWLQGVVETLVAITGEFGIQLKLYTPAAPMQIEGRVNEHYFFFRCRRDWWYVAIADADEKSSVYHRDECVYFREEFSPNPHYEAEELDGAELGRILRLCLSEYFGKSR